MIRKPVCLFPAVAAFAASGLIVVRAATPLPAWYGEPNTTRQGYEFTSASLTPPANILENAYGTPMITVNLGGFSDGWQDPANPIELSGVVANGAWDLGTAGAVTVQCQVGATPPAQGAYFHIDFQVYVVAYRGITSLPSFESPGFTALNLSLAQTTVAQDPQFPGATWEGRTWAGSFDQVTTNTIMFAIRAPGNNTAVIDTYEVFTRATLIPEPSAIFMLTLPVIGWSLRRRRS